MRRRDFINVIAGSAGAWPLLAGAATLWPLPLYGQQNRSVRVGALYLGNADADSFKTNLREGLRELGFVEGQNIAFEFRSAEGKPDRLLTLAAELVHLKVDVIVALYVPSALAARFGGLLFRPPQLAPSQIDKNVTVVESWFYAVHEMASACHAVSDHDSPDS